MYWELILLPSSASAAALTTAPLAFFMLSCAGLTSVRDSVVRAPWPPSFGVANHEYRYGRRKETERENRRRCVRHVEDHSDSACALSASHLGREPAVSTLDQGEGSKQRSSG